MDKVEYFSVKDSGLVEVVHFPELLVSRKKDELQDYSTMLTNQGVHGVNLECFTVQDNGLPKAPCRSKLVLTISKATYRESQGNSSLGMAGWAEFKCFTIKADGFVKVSHSSCSNFARRDSARQCNCLISRYVISPLSRPTDRDE